MTRNDQLFQTIFENKLHYFKSLYYCQRTIIKEVECDSGVGYVSTVPPDLDQKPAPQSETEIIL